MLAGLGALEHSSISVFTELNAMSRRKLRGFSQLCGKLGKSHAAFRGKANTQHDMHKRCLGGSVTVTVTTVFRTLGDACVRLHIVSDPVTTLAA